MILRFFCFLSRLLQVVVLCVYTKFSSNPLFSKHYCKMTLLCFLYYAKILITFSQWIWAIPILRLVGDFNLHLCKQVDFPVFYMACVFVQIKCHINEIRHLWIYFDGNFESTNCKDFNDSPFHLFNFWTKKPFTTARTSPL